MPDRDTLSEGPTDTARSKSRKPWGYSVQETAARLGIPIHKLRRWDKLGVLPANRTDGGHRRYDCEIIDGLAAGGLRLPPSQDSELAAVKEALEDKRRIIHLLLESEHRYRDLVETSHDLIWTTDSQGRFTYLNSASNEIFGLAPNDLLGRCFFDFETLPSHVSNRRFLATLKRRGEVRNHVTHLIGFDGRERWIGINARVSYGERGVITGIRGTARDVTEQHLASAELERLATRDPLTGLANRAMLTRTLESALSSGGIGALMFLDVDRFRLVNESCGHKAGDRLIAGIASVLRDCAKRTGGEVFRLGGDEFAVHFPYALRPQAVTGADALLEAVRQYRWRHREGSSISHVTASLGIALYPFHGEDAGELVASTEAALYQAKDRGRNCSVLFDAGPDGLRRQHRRTHWLREIRDALDTDRIALFQQPVVRLSTLEPMHNEVLARIRTIEGDYVAAAEFVPAAEATGIIREIDMRVIEKLVECIGRATGPDSRLRHFVNVSRASISDPRWVNRVLALLRNGRVDPGQIVFEMGESAAMAEFDVTLEFAKQLKNIGSRFALDDFGTGISSFYYLKRLDVDYLKIAGSVIREVETDAASAVFVRALNDIARGLNKQVVAECIESGAVLEELIGMGAEYGQGNLFQQPIPMSEAPQAARRETRDSKAAEH